MDQHPNARLTPRGRETLVSRIESGLGVAAAARQMGVSRQTASKWLRRSGSGEGLSDRSSRPRRLARSTPRDVEDRVCEARSSLLLAPLGLSAATGVPARTCARIVARRGLPRLADVDRVTGEVRRRGPVTPVRYERERPGELVHVDVKKVARIPDGGGWRARGESVLAHPDSGAGYACLHVAVDDFGRVAYAELLPDERKGTCAAFMRRAGALLRGAGPDGRAGDDRQRPGLPQRRVQRAAGGRRGPARIHEALQPVAERQGRADEQDDCPGVAVRKGLGQRGREGVRPPGLHRALQLGPSAQRVRGPAAHVAHRRCKQPVGTQQLAVLPAWPAAPVEFEAGCLRGGFDRLGIAI